VPRVTLSARDTRVGAPRTQAQVGTHRSSRVWARCPLDVDSCFSCDINSAQWLGRKRARAGSCHNKSSAHTIHIPGASIIIDCRRPRTKSGSVEYRLFDNDDDRVLSVSQRNGQPAPLTVIHVIRGRGKDRFRQSGRPARGGYRSRLGRNEIAAASE
jgi:hypothetical protein